MKSFKELKKMDVFKKLLDDPGDTKNVLAAKMAWQKLVMNEELPVELKKHNSLKGFIQDLLKVDVSFGLEMLKQEQEREQEKQEQEKVLTEQAQDQEQEEGHEEEVTDGIRTIVITNPKAQIKELQDQVSEKDEALKKLQENLREIDKTAKEDLQRAAEGYKKEAEKLKEELKEANIFKTRSEELRGIVEGYKKEAEKLKDELKEANVFKSRAEELQGLFDAKVGQFENLQRVHKALQEENADLQRQLNTFKKTDVEKTTELDKIGMTKTMLEHQDEVTHKLSITQANLDTANKNVGLCKARIEELENQLMNNSDEATEALLSGLKTDKAELQKQLEATKIKLTELEKKECNNCKTLDEKIADKDKEIEQLNEDLEETTKKLEEATSAVGSAQANTQRLEKEAVKPLKENLLKAKKLIEKYEGEIKVLKEEKTALEKKIQELQEQIDKGKSKMDGLEKLQNDLLAAEIALKNRDEDLKKKDKELQQALEREETLKKATNLSKSELKSHDEQLKQKDETIDILEEEIETLKKQVQEKAAAENEKPVDFGALSHSIEIGELEEKLTKFEKRARRASILGKIALIPPLFLLFFPFVPKRTWGGIKAVITYPIGVAMNLVFWVLVTYGGLNIADHFIAPAKPGVKDVTTQTFSAIEKQTKNAGIYYSIHSGAVNADPGDKISKALGEKDREFEEQLKLYILKTDIDSKYVLQTELEKYVLKTKAEADLKQALADNDASWTEKLKDYLLKSDVETNYVLKAELAKYILKSDSDAAVSQKHKQWDNYYKTQETAWNKIKAGLEQQLAEAQKKTGTVDLTLYTLKKDAEENLRLEILKRDEEWQKALNTVNGDLKAEKDKVSVLINEKAVLKQTADLVPGLNQQLGSLKVYKPAIDEIKIILMDEQGFIDCPTDKPDGSMNWYVNSFLKRGYSVSQKAQLQKTGLIVVHYSGASLIRDYKGTKYYLVVKAETPPQKK